MSKDPLDELFGPAEPDDASASQAFPAPKRPETAAAGSAPADSNEPRGTGAWPPPQPPRVPQADMYASEPETRPVPEVKKRSSAALPWIIVGAVAVVALVVALVFVNSLTNDSEEAPKPTETTSEPTTTAPTSEAPTEEPAPEPEEPTTAEPPKVDVGETYPMDISYAGISIVAPAKLNPNAWYVAGTDNDQVMFHSTLMGTFPESCADMRSVEGKSPWGIQREADGTWSVIRPTTSCAAAPELYDEVWGLLQSIADSATPLEGGGA